MVTVKDKIIKIIYESEDSDGSNYSTVIYVPIPERPGERCLTTNEFYAAPENTEFFNRDLVKDTIPARIERYENI